MTNVMALLRRLRTDRRWEGVRLNPFVLVARCLIHAVRLNPEINSTWDEAGDRIVVKPHVNLGIAAATPRGLVVPVIPNADLMDARALSDAIGQLVETARAGRTQPAQMQGGTLTITNIGALGVEAGTPILNPGEAAILAFGAIRERPWVVDGQIEVRQVAQLALSFDHRIVDGAMGARVLTDAAELLEDPSRALLL